MKNNNNLLLTIAIVFGFLFFWDKFVVSRYAPPQRSQARTAPISLGGPAKLEPMSETSASSGKESEVTLTAPGVSVVIDSLGAGVRSWVIQERNHEVELIKPGAPGSALSLATFPDLNFDLVSQENGRAVFAANTPQGFRVEKTLQLLSAPPFHSMSIAIKNITESPLTVETDIGWIGGLDKHIVGEAVVPKQESAVKMEMRAVAYGDQVRSFRPGALFSRTLDLDVPGSYLWAGVDNNHFLAALISENSSLAGLKVRASRSTTPQIETPFSKTLQPGEQIAENFLLYVGPKKYTDLQKLPYHLDASVDFGVFGVISKALLRALESFHRLTGNYGWSIILLTICIQLLVFPLTKKSLQHSIKMKELQPQLKALQAQFKKDPKRLQIETLNLYKKNGMKLMGMEGCLPILLQMPIFFALYATMRVAYELRGAPWIFWIKDLGAKDPYYVLPVVMGAGMFVQQKVTNVAVDPTQAKMMMFMPIMFTFMFLQFPAGLVLYWVVSSLTSLTIQRMLTVHLNRQKIISSRLPNFIP